MRENARGGADLIVQRFFDLDIVFSGAVLRENVRACWRDSHDGATLESGIGKDLLGLTTSPEPERGSIWPNAEGHFLETCFYDSHNSHVWYNAARDVRLYSRICILKHCVWPRVC